jgi:hypothetical protein
MNILASAPDAALLLAIAVNIVVMMFCYQGPDVV